MYGITFRRPVEEVALPCFLQFDDIAQSAILGFGEPAEEEVGSNVYSSITLVQVDSVGNPTWKTQIQAKGNLVDVVKSDGKLLAFINYQSYVDSRQIRIAKEDGTFAHLVAVVNETSGAVERLIPIKPLSSYTISRVFSLSSSEINLIGEEQGSITRKLVYLTIDNKGAVVYSNI